MKLMMQNWKWLAGLLAAVLICATYLLAQNQITTIGVDKQSVEAATVNLAPPDEVEAAASALLIEAVNVGDVQTALEILHDYGVADDTLLSMATCMGKTPAPAKLKEPFLKASVGALAVLDPSTKEQVRSETAAASGYERPVWMPLQLETKPIASYDADLSQCPLAPIAVLNVKLDDPCLIRYFQWYDRYAENLHSVVLNDWCLSNHRIDPESYAQANHTLNALFQLIKARKPDAFVWLRVVKEDNHSDEPWLKAMTFKPDGLQISNLRQFHSPFADTYLPFPQTITAPPFLQTVTVTGRSKLLIPVGRIGTLLINRTNGLWALNIVMETRSKFCQSILSAKPTSIIILRGIVRDQLKIPTRQETLGFRWKIPQPAKTGIISFTVVSMAMILPASVINGPTIGTMVMGTFT